MDPSQEKSVPTMVRPSRVRTETFSGEGVLVGKRGGGGRGDQDGDLSIDMNINVDMDMNICIDKNMNMNMNMDRWKNEK